MYDSRGSHLAKYSGRLYSGSRWKISILGAALGHFSRELANNFSRNINHPERSLTPANSSEIDPEKKLLIVSPLCFLRDMSGLTHEQPSATCVTGQVWKTSTERDILPH